MLAPLLALLIDVYSLIVMASVILSWVNVSSSNPIALFLFRATEPVLRPIRTRLPTLGGLDLSPLVLLLLLQLVRRLLIR